MPWVCKTCNTQYLDGLFSPKLGDCPYCKKCNPNASNEVKTKPSDDAALDKDSTDAVGKPTSLVQKLVAKTVSYTLGLAAALVFAGILFWDRSLPQMLHTVLRMWWMLLGAGFVTAIFTTDIK